MVFILKHKVYTVGSSNNSDKCDSINRFWHWRVNGCIVVNEKNRILMSRVDFRLKFTGKANRLKEMLIFTVLANFVYFPCISDRNLLILLNLLQNYPAHKIDHLPHLRIHSLYRDQQIIPISFVSIHTSCLCDAWINALVCTIVYYAWDLHRRSSVSNAWMHTPISGSAFNLYSFDL